MTAWSVKEANGDREWPKESRSEVEQALEDFPEMELNVETPTGQVLTREEFGYAMTGSENAADGSQEPEIVEEANAIVEPEEPNSDETEPPMSAENVEENIEEQMAEGYQQVGEETEPAEIMENIENRVEAVNEGVGGWLPANAINTDPLDTLPGWMITEVSYSDRGDTSTTVNKRGCQVIAAHLGLEVTTEAITRASETDFQYAEYRAKVVKPDGRTFTGSGTARADGQDQGENDGWKIDMQAETRAYKRAVKNATGGGIESFVREQRG